MPGWLLLPRRPRGGAFGRSGLLPFITNLCTSALLCWSPKIDLLYRPLPGQFLVFKLDLDHPSVMRSYSMSGPQGTEPIVLA